MAVGQQLDDPPHTIDAYLRALNRALRGPGQWRRRVLLEIEDGLRAELDSGADEAELVRDWGSVSTIAAEFNQCGRQVRARQMAWQIIRLVAPVTVGWWLMVTLSPDPWQHEPVLVRLLAPLVFGSVLLVVAGAVALIRPLARRSMPNEIEPVAVICVCAGVGIGVVSTGILFFARLIASDGRIFWPATVPAALLTMALVVIVVGNTRQLSRRYAES